MATTDPLIPPTQDVAAQIDAYIAGQPAAKQSDMQRLHALVLATMPGCRLWFLDGRDDTGKTVSNPSIGYGLHTLTYADGKTRDFYKIGLSANTGGLSVYIMGAIDKTYLARTYGAKLGKAGITGYCLRFKALKDIDIDVLQAAIRDGGGTSHA